MSVKTATRNVAALVVAALITWMAAHVDWRELAQRLIGASSMDLAVMAVAWISTWLLRPLRLMLLLRILGHVDGVSYRTVWTSMVLGATVNSFAPMRAGDAVLAIFLRQKLGVEIHRGLTAIVADMLCDFVCIVAIFVGALAFAPAVSVWTDQAVMFLVAVTMLALASLWAVLHFQQPLIGLVDYVLTRLAPRWQPKGREVAQDFLSGLTAISNLRAAVPLFTLSVVIWTAAATSYWFGIRAVFPATAPAAAAFTMSAVTLSFAIPLPAGLGAFEAATVLALAVFQIPLASALAFALIAHVFQLGCTLLFAVVAVLTRQIDFQSLLGKTADRQ